MISSAEFQQKLRSGQIYEALALVVQETIELEITTRLAQQPQGNGSEDGVYLRTKISLLTGNIQNEVGKNVVTNPNFQQLQQLHIEQLLANQRSVQGYLEQIHSILAILPPSSIPGEGTQLPPLQSNFEAIEQAVALVSSIDTTSDLDEDFDLSLDRDGEVWEEWVEDEDFISRSDILIPPSISQQLPQPEAPTQWLHKPLDPISVKPLVPRVVSTPVDSATQWEKFQPEYIGPNVETQPRVKHYPDPQQMDKILADLDI